MDRYSRFLWKSSEKPVRFRRPLLLSMHDECSLKRVSLGEERWINWNEKYIFVTQHRLSVRSILRNSFRSIYATQKRNGSLCGGSSVARGSHGPEVSKKKREILS